MQTLSDYHEFEYVAQVPWAVDNVEHPQQFDWIHRMETIEGWLDQHIGGYYTDWCWHDTGPIAFANVAFKMERSKSMFLLRWA